MLRRISFLALLLLLAAGTASAQEITPVCDLKVDANGDCVVDTPPLDQEVTVEGVVLAWKQFGTRGAGAIYDPSSGCCISIFDITDAPDLAIGTRVVITGWVGQFAGLLEIVDNPADGTMDPIVTDLGPGVLPPMMYPETSQLADFSPWAEEHESCLMAVCGYFDTTDTVFGSNVNYTFVGVSGAPCTVRIDADTDLVGQPIPTGQVLVSGILGQFNGFTDTCVGYQLLPRSVNDIAEGDCASVPTEQKSWGSLKGGYQD